MGRVASEKRRERPRFRPERGRCLTILLIVVPLVLAYGFWVYRVFRGKVKLEKMSY